MYTKEFIIDEISHYDDYDIDILKTKSEEELNVIFNSHCERYSVEVKAKDLIDNYQNIDFLMSSPDGYLYVGDFWIKSGKDIITIRTSDAFSATVSTDHLFETPLGWVHAGKLSKGDLVLTKDGFREIKYINIWNNPEDVYDWEILHDNHRYWAGNGLSSHNTGKTYLTLNAVKQAQDMGYYIVYYDSENAVDRDLVEKFGIDSTKFRYEPCNTVQEFRSSVTALTDTLIAQQAKGLVIPKVMIILDSAGNLATQKEIDDAKSGSDKADMTRSKLLKSTFRILMTKLGIVKVPFLFTNHTYQCMTGETLISMADNTLKQIKDINIGDFVKTLEGSKEVTSTTEFNKSYVLEFQLENGNTFRCTPEHRFLVENEWSKETSWKTAELLDEGDYIIQI